MKDILEKVSNDGYDIFEDKDIIDLVSDHANDILEGKCDDSKVFQ